MTRRCEEVRHASILAGQIFRAERCHPGGQLSGGPDSIPVRAASRPLRLQRGGVPSGGRTAVFTRGNERAR